MYIYLADCRYFKEIHAAFGACRTILPTVPCHSLAHPVACHPDMVLFFAGSGRLICAPEVFKAYHRLLSPYGVCLVQGKSALGCDYPHDVAYNVLSTATHAFARKNSVDPVILDYLEKKNIHCCNVNQGYARCSTVLFGDRLITADPSVHHAAKAAGFTVLFIRPGYVELPGYDYGFLGGASGLLEGNTVAFFGDLNTHPDGLAIRQFISGGGFHVCEIPGRPLTDIGTLLCIEL